MGSTRKQAELHLSCHDRQAHYRTYGSRISRLDKQNIPSLHKIFPKQIIRNNTGKAYSKTELQNLLQHKDYQTFAIDQLTRRKDFSKRTVEAILKSIEANPTLLKSSLHY